MLKELEGLALGIVFKSGPCTAYTVRQLLKNSPSSHWRGSAGSIYPLLERLEALALIEAREDPHDGRARRLLSVTKEGRKALKAWVKGGAEPDIIAQVFDPVRTRVFFMDALTPKERARVAANMLTALESFLMLSRDQIDGRRNELSPLGRLGALGAVMTNEARVAFMKEVVAALQDPD